MVTGRYMGDGEPAESGMVPAIILATDLHQNRRFASRSVQAEASLTVMGRDWRRRPGLSH